MGLSFSVVKKKVMDKSKKKRRVNKATKTAVVFDPEARKDFLTGFRKRKNARRAAAKVQMEKELKEEIKKAKEKAKERIGKAFEAEKNRSNILTEIAELVPSSIQDTGTHTISVTHIDSFSKTQKDDSESDADEEESGETGQNGQIKPIVSKKEPEGGQQSLSQVPSQLQGLQG